MNQHQSIDEAVRSAIFLMTARGPVTNGQLRRRFGASRGQVGHWLRTLEREDHLVRIWTGKKSEWRRSRR